MSIVVDVARNIDGIVWDYFLVVHQTVTTPLLITIQYVALAALMLMAINHVAQFKAVNYGQYFHWWIRFLFIFAFLKFYENFALAYYALTDLQSDYSNALIKAALKGTEGLNVRPDIFDLTAQSDSNAAVDQFNRAMTYVANLYFKYARSRSIFDAGSIIVSGLTGIVIILIGYVFTAIAIVLLIFAKIGVAVAMSLMPLAFLLLMMEQTRSYFESWVKFLVGFFIIPILTASLMALMVFAAGVTIDRIEEASKAKSSSGKATTAHVVMGDLISSGAELKDAQKGVSGGPGDDYLALVLVTFGSLIFLSQVPSMASNLASSSVASVGASLASSQRLWNGAKRMGRTAQRGRDAMGAANAARKAGGGVGSMALAAVSSMRQSAGIRQSRRDDRMMGRMRGEAERQAEVRKKTLGGYTATGAPIGPNAPGINSGAAGANSPSNRAANTPSGAGNSASSNNPNSNNPGGSGAGANNSGGPAASGAGGIGGPHRPSSTAPGNRNSISSTNNPRGSTP
ncbi:type IV secretion system protein [Rhizobium terrae]|uniref:type IV secretion system protein n=1 Tax=Rhizobium terrae TaxID=2171756 RepID=UPI000E3B7DAD|nr:type IV secretion system protein [Rhizobium terrae]